MHVVLARPPFIGLASGPPLGLLHLAAELRGAGHRVTLWDPNVALFRARPHVDYDRCFEVPASHPAVAAGWANLDRYAQDLLDLQPDVVGFNLMYCNAKFGLALAGKLRGKVRCIAGGPQCTFHPEEVLGSGHFAAVVPGYGEEAVHAALTEDGVVERDIVKGKPYLPDLSLLRPQDYLGLYPLLTSRGCPNRCAFCTQHLRYLMQPMDAVMAQVRALRGLPLRQVMYTDSNINVLPTRTRDLFRAVADEGPRGVPGHVFGLQVKPGFEAYVGEMARAGVKEVRLGIESGSPRERAAMNKPRFDNDTAVRLVEALGAVGITTWAQFIFCWPDQTDVDRAASVELMQRMNAAAPGKVRNFWYQFVVHRGTESWFAENHGVEATTVGRWRNAMYDRATVLRLWDEWKPRAPRNVAWFIDPEETEDARMGA